MALQGGPGWVGEPSGTPPRHRPGRGQPRVLDGEAPSIPGGCRAQTQQGFVTTRDRRGEAGAGRWPGGRLLRRGDAPPEAGSSQSRGP